MDNPYAKFAKQGAENPYSKFAKKEEKPATPKSSGPLQAADDIVRMLASGATFGYADKLAAKMDSLTGGGDYQSELAQERQATAGAAARSGSAGTAANLAGAIATPGGLASRGVTLAGRAGTAAMKGLPGVAARTGLMSAEGAGYGALTAAGNDQDTTRGALIGALAGTGGNLAGEALSGTISKIAAAFNKKPVVPDANAIRAAKDAAYKQAENAGAIYTPQMVNRVKQSVVADLARQGYHPELQPGVKTVLAELDRLGQGNVTLTGVDTLRQIAGGAYNPMNKKQNMFIGKIISAIDDAVSNPQAGDVLAGNAADAGEAITRARSLYRQSSRLDDIATAMKKGERQAMSTGSGGNIDNAIRQKFRSILDSPARSRGFTKDEIAAMEDIVSGRPTQNAMRLIGKLSPQGNGLMAMLHLLGAGASGGATVPLAGVGMAAKTVADRSTPANVQALETIVRAGGNRSAALAPPNAVQRLAESKRAALVQALMAGGVNTALAP